MKLIVVFLVVLAALGWAWRSRGPGSFRAAFARETAAALARPGVPPPLTEQDIAGLPAAVRRYLRVTGAVGRPRVLAFRARFTGRIRSGSRSRWMRYQAEQVNTYDPVTRRFLMDASLFGVPFQAFHRYVGPSAGMRVRLAGLVPLVDARGPEMDQAETVTLLNDMCLFAPGALAGADIAWRELGPRAVHASFTNAGHTVTATLTFAESGELLDFVSDDRFRTTAEGRLERERWSTPVRDYRAYGPVRLASRGEGRWHGPEGAWSYITLQLEAIEYDVGS